MVSLWHREVQVLQQMGGTEKGWESGKFVLGWFHCGTEKYKSCRRGGGTEKGWGTFNLREIRVARLCWDGFIVAPRSTSLAGEGWN